MTEQVKKATRSIHITEVYNPDKYASRTSNIGLYDIFNSLYNSDMFYANQDSSIGFGKGKTNWGTGDIFILKASIYLWINATSGTSPSIKISTSNGYLSGKVFSKTNVNFDTLQKESCTIVPLDTLLCKCTSKNIIEVQMKDRAYEKFVNYSVSCAGAIFESQRIILEAAYLGTEQEDGNIVYLA